MADDRYVMVTYIYRAHATKGNPLAVWLQSRRDPHARLDSSLLSPSSAEHLVFWRAAGDSSGRSASRWRPGHWCPVLLLRGARPSGDIGLDHEWWHRGPLLSDV
jgi:hypothetical protein